MVDAISAIKRKNPFISEDAYKLYATTQSYNNNNVSNMEFDDKMLATRGFSLVFPTSLPEGANAISGGNCGGALNMHVTPQQKRCYEETLTFGETTFMTFA